jgi:hypothetical protein
MHGESILGPLPKSWAVKLAHTESDLYTESSCNYGTGVITFDDPPLECLPSEWSIETESTVSLIRVAEPRLVNQVTGEVRETDPRLTPEAFG